MERKRRNAVLEKTMDVYNEYCGQLCNGRNGDNARQRWQRLTYHNRECGPSLNITDRVWPIAIQNGIGRFMYQILIRDIKIDVNAVKTGKMATKQNLLPAFYTLFRNEGKFVKEEVKPHPVLAKYNNY